MRWHRQSLEGALGHSSAALVRHCRMVCAGGLAVALLGASARAGAAQEAGTVAGIVAAEGTAAPLPDVQVSVEGTTQGALTDAAGRFRIVGLSGDTVRLSVRRLGYRPETRVVPVGAADVQFTLTPRALELDRVVVTGTAGATEQRALGNAVSQVRAADVVATQPIRNFQELLNARAPGVNIIPGSGQVGSGARIRIRGASSLSLTNEPLIYVDGVRVDNTQASGPESQSFGSRPISRWNDFNPQDIESIEIIKGPAAATLYGTEAANGVIQIITKKGAVGRPRFDMTVRQGANWFQNPEGRVWTNYGVVPIDTLPDETVVLDTTTLDIVDLENARGRPIFRTGQLQEYNLAVSGGSPSFRYYVGGGTERNEGAERNNKLERYNGRLNLSLSPSSTWDASANLAYTTGRTDIGFEAGGGGTTWTTYFADPANLSTPTRGFQSGPPEAYYAGFEIFQDIQRFTGSVTFNHRPLPWLNHRLTAGTDRINEDNEDIGQRNETLSQYFEELGGGEEGTNGYMVVSTRDVRNNTLDYGANLRFDVSPSLLTTTSFGAQYYNKITHRRAISGTGFPAPGFKSLQTLAVISQDDDDVIENNTVGFYAQEQLGWNNRLFVTGALRADDNSAFGKNFDRAYYPKASVSWVASEEPFFTLPFVNALKLRAAYGHSGQQPDAFAALATYLAGGAGTVTPGALGNPNLGPERSYETELGFDAGFLNDRAGIEFTYYTGTTKDAILSRDVAPSTGFGGEPNVVTGKGIQYFNAGRVARNGVELLLRAQPIERENLALDLSFSIGTNTNKIKSLGTDPSGTPITFIPVGGTVAHVVGYPVGSWFSRRIVSAEFDPVAKEAINVMCDDGNGGSVACANAPRVYLGNTIPKTEGAFTGTVTLYKNFRLNALVDFKRGYKKLDGNRRVRCNLFGLCRENYFPEEFDPKVIAETQGGTAFVTNLIHDASFAKLREVALTYTLPPAWAGLVSASHASVTVAGRNLHTWTDWPGLEPEASFLGGTRGGYGQWEQNVMPQLATFITSINVGF